MTFDPFGDYETHGYLRNVATEKDLAIVKRLEHASFLTGIDEAFAALAKHRKLTMQMCSILTGYSSKLFTLGLAKTGRKPRRG